ncbi:MAG: hypothetical protein ACFFG0_03975 [Candidatus Thorarchaeota archaeon]
MSQKCYGKNCTVGFLCRQVDDIKDLIKRCDLIIININEEIKQLPDTLTGFDRKEEVTGIIIEVFKHTMNEIKHQNKESLWDSLTYELMDSEGCLRYLVRDCND